MITDPFFYLVAFPAVMIVGLSKGGFAGLGVLGIPILSMAISPVQAASIMLPILIVQDAVGVWAFRKAYDIKTLKLMLPAAVIGITAGYLLAALVRPAAIELAVGLIALGFGVQRLWAARAIEAAVKEGPHAWVGFLCGAVSGFTSQIAHAGGPPFQVYALSKRFERDVFIGTSSIFFAAVNWLKVPAYMALGQFTRQNLLTSLALFPLALLSTWLGVLLVRKVSKERFYTFCYTLLMLLGLKLIWDGGHGLLA
jgi:uncharacterized membrane protein YfcA